MKLVVIFSLVTFLSFSQDKKLPYPNIVKPINSYEYVIDTVNGLLVYKNKNGSFLKGNYSVWLFLMDIKKKEVKRSFLIDENGNKTEIFECGNGREFSNYKRLNINEKGSFVKGYKNGFWKTTYKSKLVKTINYNNGLITGRYRIYNSKGDLLYKTTFGSKGNGKYKDYYYKTGILKEEGNYENGKKEGEWCLYDEQGNTTKIEYFKKGELIKKE